MAGMGKRAIENSDRAALNVRMVRALGRRIGVEGDTDQLRHFAEVDAALTAARAAAVDGLRRQGYSWAEVADGLGVSRQAAHAMYHKAGAD